MEFEINLRKDEEVYWLTALMAVVIALIIVFGWIGRGVTPTDDAGNPRLLSWPDWELIQAEREHTAELSTLQGDASKLALALQERPDPVAAQFLVSSVARHVQSESDPSLASARQALVSASLDVRDWASGALDRNTAVQSLQEAMALLK
ncbi:MAG TPA: hypothetical protein VLX61_00980 [Anaerolineales bacterium]|nr:hypothetical protein [Anaerolineales bacterium]